LSGGNQQKLVAGKWLATAPKVLLLDEPTKGVDVGAKFEIHRIIRRNAATGMACLMVSSDLPEVLALADRIVVMREGRVRGELDGPTATEERVMRLATHEVEGAA
jgi:ABC-type sugar transport system ATPase subunit